MILAEIGVLLLICCSVGKCKGDLIGKSITNSLLTTGKPVIISDRPTEGPTENPTTEEPKPPETPTSEAPTTGPTTVLPTTTSEAPTTGPTTVLPTTIVPSADPEMNFNGTDNRTTCILLKGRFLFSVGYPKKDGTVGSVNVGVHDVTSTKGDCNGTMKTNQLKVEFFEGWDMVIEFGADKATTALLSVGDDGDDTFWWQQLNLTYKYDDKLMPDLNMTFNGQTMTAYTTLDHQFRASRDGSYQCNSETVIYLSDGATLTLSDLQYQAFQTNTTGFPSDNLTECIGDASTNYIVTLAVGAVLIVLAVIYLVTYIIDRVRVRNREGFVPFT